MNSGRENSNGNSKLLILCGYTGSGKSTVGKLLAKRLGLPFYDTDRMLVEKYDMSVPELYVKYGEAGFRDLEHEIAVEASKIPEGVVATGGGMMIYDRNIEVLKARGKVIYICRPFEDCYEFLSQHPERPLIRNNTKEELEQRYLDRDRAYRSCADIVVKNTTNPRDTTRKLVKMLVK